MSDFVRTLLGLVLRGAISKSKVSGARCQGASKDTEDDKKDSSSSQK